MDKTPNYTTEMVEALHAGYDGTASDTDRQAQVAALALQVGRSERSVRAKLTREGIYVTLTKAPAGKNTVRKSDLIALIADKLEVTEDVIGSLEKATKNVLVRLVEAL